MVGNNSIKLVCSKSEGEGRQEICKKKDNNVCYSLNTGGHADSPRVRVAVPPPCSPWPGSVWVGGWGVGGAARRSKGEYEACISVRRVKTRPPAADVGRRDTRHAAASRVDTAVKAAAQRK